LLNPDCLATSRRRRTACEQLAAYIKEQRIKYDKLIKQTGLKGERKEACQSIG
jgi:hypothetical protein